MNIRVVRTLSSLSILALLAVGFQNCSATHFTYDDATFASKATGDSETLIGADVPELPAELPVTPLPEAPPAVIVQQPEPPPSMPAPMALDPNDEFADFYHGICKELQGVTLPLAISAAAPDLTVKNTYRSVVIEEGRNVIVKNHVSQTRVRKAETLKLQNLGGKTLVSANRVLSAENIVGRLCINAVVVDRIHNVANNTKVIANEITEISNIIGDLHVYRATVGLLKNSVGRICLHDGAKILNYSNSYAKVGDCR